MLTLNEILNETQDGEKITTLTKQLGFETVRLFNSFAKNTLCLVVNFDKEKKEPNADQNAMLLKIKLARELGCTIIVLQNDFLTEEDRQLISNYSVPLPVKNSEQLKSIFGNPEEFKIKQLEEDKVYSIELEVFEKRFSAELEAVTSKINSSNSSQKDRPAPLTHSYESGDNTLKQVPFNAQAPNGIKAKESRKHNNKLK